MKKSAPKKPPSAPAPGAITDIGSADAPGAISPGATSPGGTSPGDLLPPGVSFDSMNEVVRHLTDAGYITSRSKISRDKGKGMIRVNVDGSILESEVRAYAATLKRVVADVGDLNDIHAIKAAREVEKLEEQIKKLQFERQKEEGLYLPKKDFESELAARAVVFEAGFRHLFNMKVQEWVTMVNGSQEKTADLLQNLNVALDDQLNVYASTDTFQVMFDGREE